MTTSTKSHDWFMARSRGSDGVQPPPPVPPPGVPVQSSSTMLNESLAVQPDAGSVTCTL